MPFKPAKTEALRTFVVLDSDLVVSGLAALDGGAIDEILTHVTDDEQSQKGGHIGGRPIKAQASKNRGRKVQEEMLRKRTEHSAAASLIDRLLEMEAVGVVDGALDDEVVTQLEPGLTIQVRGDLNLHPLHQADEMLKSFIKAAPTFGDQESARELRKIMPIWNAMLGNGNSAQVLYDLSTFAGQSPRVLEPCKRGSLQMPAAEVTGFCTALAKVERVLTAEDQILALRVLQNAPVSQLELTAIEEGAVELVDGFAEMGIPCSPDDVVMRGPLIMLRPLCVWR